MKVPGSDGSDSVLKRVQEGRVGEQAGVRKSAGVSTGAAASLSSELQRSEVDTMKFSSLGAMLRQELDPARMMDERRAKIEALKDQIRNGTYAPSSVSVAQSLSEEISTEVLFGGKYLADETA
jgi:anti-sigma28 factor (negative regulator of flagellin synthesis)